MIQIDELLIRIPAINEEEAGRIGNEVARLVSEALPDVTANNYIPELKIQMTSLQLNGSASMVAAIADQIVTQIKLASL